MHRPPDRPAHRGEPRVLVIDTAHRVGLVAIAEGMLVQGDRRIDEARRHARDLVPAMRDLLAGAAWKPRDLDAVIVSRGPGSYTGLRVGIISAKTLAYATGCALVAVDTFAAIALQAPFEALTIDVIADAQQDKLYVQRYARTAGADRVVAMAPLAIEPFAAWQAALCDATCVTGPGLEAVGSRLPSATHVAPPDDWLPHTLSLLWLGLDRFDRGERDEIFAVEPLYLRASSAEEKRQGKPEPAPGSGAV